ncbi:MAG: CBS domain-containing protein [Enterococcus canintestini]|uniref:CBS domain-containing protein n=1 Tax=Enterococcus TaxID=1350 RepID=UPI003992E889
MASNADIFLASFNRINKWLKEKLNHPQNMGFSEMVRRLSRQPEFLANDYVDDLLQMAQLRNAIVHDQISTDFVIAEPNDWVVKRITMIEQALLKPELVLPRFGKNVTGFEITLPIKEILKTIAHKRYSQFPLYEKGVFKGLITLRALGYWFAKESLKGEIVLENRLAEELLIADGKVTNYQFVTGKTTVAEVENMFHQNTLLEAILITRDGDPNGNLLGIIRPRDLFTV